MGLTYLFISHDLSVVEHVSDRVAVMYLGTIVELAPAQELYAQPRHPYTEALLSSVPRADPDVHAKRMILPGDVPSPSNPPPGCKFHPRCRYAQAVCSTKAPDWREVSPQHWVACHRADELDLAGIIEQE
jgi:oligopeptide/dipeptide ABC transporter ATP-binding protein